MKPAELFAVYNTYTVSILSVHSTRDFAKTAYSKLVDAHLSNTTKYVVLPLDQAIDRLLIAEQYRSYSCD